jgi:hypothetical protein
MFQLEHLVYFGIGAAVAMLFCRVKDLLAEFMRTRNTISAKFRRGETTMTYSFMVAPGNRKQAAEYLQRRTLELMSEGYTREY